MGRGPDAMPYRSNACELLIVIANLSQVFLQKAAHSKDPAQ